MPAPIEDGESAAAVRAKINAGFEEAAAAALAAANKLSASDAVALTGTPVTPASGGLFAIFQGGQWRLGLVNSLIGSLTPEQIVAAIEGRTGEGRLDALRLKNLPSVSGFAPVVLTHNGDPETGPVPGDTITATYAPGWASSTRGWKSDGATVDGRTALTYEVRLEDAGLPVRHVMGLGGGVEFESAPLLVAGGGATVPAAFGGGDWVITNATTLTLTALPSDGGSAITALQYDVNGSGTATLSGTGAGAKTISALTEGDEVRVRAVNAEGNGPWSAAKEYGAASDLVEGLLEASTFGFVIAPNNSAITRCYTETTGLSATTLCVNDDEIGTIRCMITDRVITFPTGTKPVFKTASGRSWIETRGTGRIFWEAGSTFTGSGDLLMAFAGMKTAEISGISPWLATATLGTNPPWDYTSTGGLGKEGAGFGIVRGGGPSGIPSFGANFDRSASTVSVIGSTRTRYAAVRDDDEQSIGEHTYAALGAWGVNRAYFASSPDDSTVFEGEIHFAAVLDVSGDATATAAAVMAYGRTQGGW